MLEREINPLNAQNQVLKFGHAIIAKVLMLAFLNILYSIDRQFTNQHGNIICAKHCFEEQF